MRGKGLTVTLVVLACISLLGPAAQGEVKPHGLISDGMVLQQGKPVPIWGTADDGEKVTVRFAGQEVSTTAQGGKWTVRLEPLRAGGPSKMAIEGTNTVEINNVLVGEVWVCSGQSNMAWRVKQSADPETTVANSANPMIHLFTVPTAAVDEPLNNVAGAKWQECGPETVGEFSAVGYFFGRELQRALKVPVGLINSSVGGTPAEAWTSRRVLQAEPDLKAILDQHAKAVEDYPKLMERHNKGLAKREKRANKAKGQSTTAPQTPKPPVNPVNHQRPCCLYNGMIAPLLPYAIAGAIWYQGESNVGRAYQYRTLFPAMIKNWRDDWKQGDFPFLFVQLAPFGKIVDEPADSAWAELREAQLLTSLNVPNTAMAVITDVGDPNNIHPKQKQPVGTRLALSARALANGENITYCGPVYTDMKTEGNKAILSFKHVGGGLVAKDGPPKGFAIAGEDHKFANADAEIQGDKVVASSPQVPKPAAVRLGWADCPVVNLWNKDGLPASPFRTDAFPMVTGPQPSASK